VSGVFSPFPADDVSRRIAALERLLASAALLRIELDPKLRVLAATPEPSPGRYARRGHGSDAEVLTSELPELADSVAALAGLPTEFPVFGAGSRNRVCSGHGSQTIGAFAAAMASRNDQGVSA
jgi:hypothetical protein